MRVVEEDGWSTLVGPAFGVVFSRPWYRVLPGANKRARGDKLATPQSAAKALD